MLGEDDADSGRDGDGVDPVSLVFLILLFRLLPWLVIARSLRRGETDTELRVNRSQEIMNFLHDL